MHHVDSKKCKYLLEIKKIRILKKLAKKFSMIKIIGIIIKIIKIKRETKIINNSQFILF